MANRRKSQFPKSTTVKNTDQFDFVGDSTNVGISFNDLKDNLGVTGTLEQAGDPQGVAILQKSGTANNIRTLENGSGTKPGLTPRNGIKVDHNFTVDAVGNPMMLNTTALSPVIPSLAAGSGINISMVDNRYVFTVSGITAPTTTVVVLSEDDLPAPVGGFHQLADCTNYVQGNDITITTPIKVGNLSSWTCGNTFCPTLTYNGTGALFTGIDATFHFFNGRIDCPNATAFDMKNVAAPNTSVVIIREINILNCAKVAVFDTMVSLVLTGNVGVFNATQGIEIKGAGWRIWRIENTGMNTTNAANIGIDMGTATCGQVIIDKFFYTGVSGSTTISGLASNGNITAGSVGTISNVKNTGAVTPLAGLTSDDERWIYSNNEGIAPTRPDALISITGNALQTVISAPSSDGTNAVKMNGVWAVEKDSHFTADATGRITYNGEVPFTAPIDFNIRVLMASGSTKTINAYVVVNDGSTTVIEATGMNATPTSTTTDAMTAQWQHTFELGHWCEVWLENESDAVNIIGQRGTGRVN